jgi:hypothetical protein
VPWTEAYFSLIGGQQAVPTNDTLTALLAADPNAELLGPFGGNKAGTELVRTRVAMHVPFRYVPIFLGSPLSPWEAIQRVYGVLQGDNKLEECRPLLNFLKVCMSRAGPHNVPVTVQLLQYLLSHRTTS